MPPCRPPLILPAWKARPGCSSELPGRTLVPGASITLRFEDGRASGSDGCNRYGISYSTAGSKLDFQPGGMATQMACAPELMQQASAFMASLTGARAFGMEAGQLQLLGADGAVLARFAPQSEGLAGTAWQVTGYNNGRQAVVSVLNGTELTMEFSADGRVAGSAGCNRYTGSFKQDGKSLSFGPAAATRRLCVEPEGVMEQEQQFLKALETVATARQEADRARDAHRRRRARRHLGARVDAVGRRPQPLSLRAVAPQRGRADCQVSLQARRDAARSSTRSRLMFQCLASAGHESCLLHATPSNKIHPGDSMHMRKWFVSTLATAAAVAAFAPAQAASIDSIVFFGDSLSDTGNIWYATTRLPATSVQPGHERRRPGPHRRPVVRLSRAVVAVGVRREVRPAGHAFDRGRQ